MPVRKAKAVWEGGLRQGKGVMELQSQAFQGPYSYPSRFEEGEGTNPEELIAAAHAGCFSMALAASLEREGFPPKRVSTEARVHLEVVDGKPTRVRVQTKKDGTKVRIAANDGKELGVLFKPSEK